MQRELFHAAVELRAAEAGKARTITGYAATYNSRSDKIGGQFIEMIAPGAFKNVLKSAPDVRMLVNHDPNQILGRTKSRTLTLVEDARGLRFSCEMPETTYARNAYESIKRGDMNQCSFQFGDVQDEWTDENGSPLRTIRSVGFLADVSVVAFPAYQETSVEARDFLSKIFIPKPPVIHVKPVVAMRFDERDLFKADQYLGHKL